MYIYMEINLTNKPNMANNYLYKNTRKGARYTDGLYMVDFYNKEILYNNKNLCRNNHVRPIEINHDEVS